MNKSVFKTLNSCSYLYNNRHYLVSGFVLKSDNTFLTTWQSLLVKRIKIILSTDGGGFPVFWNLKAETVSLSKFPAVLSSSGTHGICFLGNLTKCISNVHKKRDKQ